MAQDIKRKIVLEGEKEYSAALKEAQRNLKTLRSELKAETAELGANATAQQKSETRIKSLQKQIKEQEKVVKTCQAALAEAKKEYGDNEEVVAKWEQKLNDARATLANMKNDLEGANQAVRDTGNSFREAADGAAATVTATKSVADAMGQIGSVGNSVSGAIESIFTGVLNTMEKAVGAIWDMISETAARANNWTDLASYYGSSASEMQKWSNAVSASKGNFQDLVQLINTFSFGGKNKKITEWFGISDVNYKDNLAYTVAVLGQMAEMKERMVQAGTWDQAMTDIFGAKKAQNASWFISNWETITGELGKFDAENGGFGISGEELETMNQVAIKTAEIETMWASINDKIAAAFGPHVLSLETNVEGGLEALNKFLNAETPEEREQALEDLRTNVEEFFTKVADIIREGIAILNEVGHELQESDDPLTAMVGDILVKMTEAMQWMVDNQAAVKGAFETIFGAWLLAKLASVAGKLSSILLQIEAIKAFKGMATTASAAEAAGSAAGASWAAGFGAAAMKALPWLAGLVVLLTPADSADDQWDSLYDKEGNVTAAGKAQGLPATQAEYDAWGEKEWAEYNRQQAEKQAEESQKARIAAVEKYLWRKTGADYTESMYTDEAIRKLIGKDFTSDQIGALNALLDEIDQMAAAGEDVNPGALDVEAMLRKYGLFPGGEKNEQPEEAPEEPEQPKGEPKRKKNITGTATEEQMQTRPPEQEAAEEAAEAEEEAAEAMQEAAEALQEAAEEAAESAKEKEMAALPLDAFKKDVLGDMLGTLEAGKAQSAKEADAIQETADELYDAIYKAINDYDPEENQLNTTEFFDTVLYPMIQKAAGLGGVTGDEADAIADLLYDKWIQSMYDDEWEGSTAGILNILQEAIEEGVEAFMPGKQEGPEEPTDAQKDAAEAFWDAFRGSLDGAPDAFDEMLAAFEGSDELLSRLDALIGELENSTADDGWRSIENLPANWWLDAANWQNSSGNNNGITSADLQGFRSLPGNMAAAVQSGAARGVSGIKVVLDGATVGRLVAPYVSETIARDVII